MPTSDWFLLFQLFFLCSVIETEKWVASINWIICRKLLQFPHSFSSIAISGLSLGHQSGSTTAVCGQEFGDSFGIYTGQFVQPSICRDEPVPTVSFAKTEDCDLRFFFSQLGWGHMNSCYLCFLFNYNWCAAYSEMAFCWHEAQNSTFRWNHTSSPSPIMFLN